MYKYAEMLLVPFDNNLHVYIGKYEGVNNVTLSKFNYNLAEYAFDSSGIFHTTKKNYIVWCETKKSLLHELSHVVDKLLNHYGILDTEFRAYYLEYLYNYLIKDSNYKIVNKKEK